MAFYLNNDGISNARVDLASTIFVGANVGDYIEFDIEGNAGNDAGAYRIASGEQLNFRAILEVGTTQVFLRPDNNDGISFSTGYTQPPIGQRFKVKVERVASGVWECFIDDVSIGTGASNENFKIIQFGDFRIFNNAAFQGKFYRIKASTDGGVSVTNDWVKSTLAQPNDPTFTDTVGGNDGTLVNFPTDNSQWIFYNDGGGAVTADTAYTINAPTFTSSASVTLPASIANSSFALAAPAFSASANASLPQPVANGAFSIASPSFSVSADVSLPQPIANAAFTLNAPTFSASATATIPGFSASVAYTVNAPTFAADAAVTLPQPTADVTYTVTAPTFSVDSAVTLPQPTANAAFSLPAPTFAASATATQAGFNASVNFTLPAPTFSADTTATLPQPIADGNFTVTVPTFSVVAIAGGIAIIVDNETNINMPALSTNINAPVLSNNVRI